MLEASRTNYILVLVRALEKRALDGNLDEELAARIERMLGFGSEAGDREYESWFPIIATAPCASDSPCPECHNANGHYEGCGRGFVPSGPAAGVPEVPRG